MAIPLAPSHCSPNLSVSPVLAGAGAAAHHLRRTPFGQGGGGGATGWGATLAAAYLGEHRERVANVVFSSPGALSLGDDGDAGTGAVDRRAPDRRAEVKALLSRPRALAAWAVTAITPRAAHAFASDGALDAHYDRSIAASAPGFFCDRTWVQRVTDGTRFSVKQVTLADQSAPDPRAGLTGRTRHRRTPGGLRKRPFESPERPRSGLRGGL